MRGADFRDPAFFIDNDLTPNSEEAQRSRQIEAAMQPSAASAARGTVGNALRIEEAILDIVGDENEELVKKQRMMRWDRSKRKYVQTTVGDELNGDSKSKKVRLESGQVVRNDKLKLGELYEKWQKKTNRSVGRSGVFDDEGVVVKTGRTGKKGRKTQAGSNGDKLKSAIDIRKEREKKQNLKIKNMKKADRRLLERRQSEERDAQARSGGGALKKR